MAATAIDSRASGTTRLDGVAIHKSQAKSRGLIVGFLLRGLCEASVNSVLQTPIFFSAGDDFFLLATRHLSLATSLHLLAAQGRAGFNFFTPSPPAGR